MAIETTANSTELTLEELAFLARLIGVHTAPDRTTAGGVKVQRLYSKLAAKCDFADVDCDQPLNLSVLEKHQYGKRVMLRVAFDE